MRSTYTAAALACTIDFQRLLLNLRTHYGPLSQVAREVGADGATLTRIARGETRRLSWGLALALLNLHARECRALHTLEGIGAADD